MRLIQNMHASLMHRQSNRQFDGDCSVNQWSHGDDFFRLFVPPCPPQQDIHTNTHYQDPKKHMGNVVQQKLATGPLSFQWLTLISPIFPSEMLGVTARLSRVLQILRLFGAWHGMVCPQDIIPFVPSWVLDISHVTP